jgi:hypothetical protein
MYYFFFDESYPPASSEKKIVTAAWSVEEYKWNPSTLCRADLFKSPVLERIGLMLESLDGHAVIATATLGESLFRGGEIDRTDDIASMARPDNVWSTSAIFTLSTLILELFIQRRQIDTIDVHLDLKSLTSAHSEAVKKTLRELVVRRAKQFASERGFKHLKKLRIRRVEFVRKAAVGDSPDKFQMGTWIADKLCSHSNRIDELRKFPRIHIHDMSDVVRRTVQQFDGKSFCE